MTKLLYVPDGKILTWAVIGSGKRTAIIEESAVYLNNTEYNKDIKVMVESIIYNRNSDFRYINEIHCDVCLEEFEVIYD